MQTVLYLCAFLKLLQHSLNLHAGMKFFLLYFTRKKSSIRFRRIKLSLFLNRDAASVIFILATTELDRVPETIISRCQCYDFKRISVADIVLCLKNICTNEGFNVDDEVYIYFQ